jgi:filamentous hemagglutinin family protein
VELVMARRATARLAIPALVVASALCLTPALARAQVPTHIETDGSLGDPDPVSVPGVDRVFTIGEKHGSRPPMADGKPGVNLFHSFGTFDVGAGDTALFTADSPTETVISRVTGGTRSQIYGKIRSDIYGADLFLLNPWGIIFGEEAELDVKGSFHASSADVLRFEDGNAFSAGDLSQPPVLTKPAPAAFGFTSADPGSERIGSVKTVCKGDCTPGLQVDVPDGGTFSLIGRDLEPGKSSAGVDVASSILAPGARVQLASAAPGADIPLDLEKLKPRALESGTLGDIKIADDAQVSVSTPSGEDTPAGKVLIRGERFQLRNGGTLLAQHASETAAPVVGIDVEVTGAIQIENGSGVHSWSSGESDHAGHVWLKGDSITLSGGSRDGREVVSEVSTVAKGTGEGGDVLLEAASVSLVSRGAILSRSARDEEGRAGKAGNLKIGSPEMAVETLEIAGVNSRIESTNESDASAGGAIEVWAGSVTVSEAGRIASLSEGDGAGGAIALETGSLEVTDGGQVHSETDAGGVGGELTVSADSVLVSNQANNAQATFIAAETTSTGTLSTEGGTPDGGALTIKPRDDEIGLVVELVDGGQIFTRTDGAGRAGTLTIEGADRVHVFGRDDYDGVEGPRPSSITSRARENATATEGGLLSIRTRVLAVEGEGEISSATYGQAPAGRLEIAGKLENTEAERVTIKGGEDGVSLVSVATLSPYETGRGGDLEIRTDVLELKDGGHVTASTNGRAAAGALTVSARRVEVSGAADPEGHNPSGIFSQSNVGEGGAGGNLTIVAAESVAVSDGGRISVETSGSGNAGNLSIAVDDTVDLASGGQISALTSGLGEEAGDGGSIRISAGRGVRLGGSASITASSTGTGAAGSIFIDAGESLTSTGSSISTEARRPSDAGGEIWIQAADRIALSEGARIDTSISVPKDDEVHFDVDDFSLTENGEIDIDLPAGRIDIRGTGSDSELALSGDSEISASFLNQKGAEIRVVGEEAFDALLRVGGDVEISGLREVDLSGGSEIAVEAVNDGSLAAVVEPVNDGSLAVVTDGQAEATVTLVGGSITVAGGERVTLSDDATITADSTGTGGQITIQAREMVYLLDSIVKTNVSQPGSLGNGGDILIDPRFVVLNRSDIRANAMSGEGGHISIRSDVFMRSGDSTVDASAEEGPGIDGIVEISAPETNLSGELATLPQTFLDVAALETSRCAARTARAGSFVVARRGAMPAPPDAPLSHEDVDGLAAVAAPPVDVEACPELEETP